LLAARKDKIMTEIVYNYVVFPGRHVASKCNNIDEAVKEAYEDAYNGSAAFDNITVDGVVYIEDMRAVSRYREDPKTPEDVTGKHLQLAMLVNVAHRLAETTPEKGDVWSHDYIEKTSYSLCYVILNECLGEITGGHTYQTKDFIIGELRKTAVRLQNRRDDTFQPSVESQIVDFFLQGLYRVTALYQ
jgi:hypothetical protein